MKIAIVCHNFYPEPNAPAARFYEMARRWIACGHEVTVVTGFPHHPTGIIPEFYRGKWFMYENIEGIRVYRSYVYAVRNKGVVRRTWSHVTFMLSALVFSLFRIDKPDVVLSSSPTLISGIAGYLFGVVRKAPLIFEVRDLWPEAIADLGLLRGKRLIGVLKQLELFLYRRSARVVVVTKAFRSRIVDKGIPAEKIAVIPNGADLSLFHGAADSAADALRVEYGWQNKRILLYCGTIGLSQGLSNLLEVARRMREDPELLFVFVGDGADKIRLRRMAEAAKLDNVQFIDPQPRQRLPGFYRVAELAFALSRDLPVFAASIPSKIFEILGSGCPLVAAVTGEAADIVRQSGGGIVVPPENADELERATTGLLRDRDRGAGMRGSGIAYVREHYSRTELADRYIPVLERVLSGGGEPS